MSGLLNRALYCERKRLMQCADRFTKAMKVRLVEMMLKGYRGWDNPARLLDFKKTLLEYAQENYYQTKRNEDDVANLSLIIWNLWEKEKRKGTPTKGAP